MIACNLAVALARDARQQVALADFSLQFGDVGIMLNLRSPHGVHELMYTSEDLDKTLLDNVMVPHQSGVRVLLAPTTLAAAEQVNTEGLIAVIEALRRYHDFVVVDTWHTIEEATLAIMDASSTVLVVTTPDVPALRDTRRAIDFLRSHPGLGDKIRVVLNRQGSAGAVDQAAIAEALDAPPFATIPNDGRLVTNSTNDGVAVLSRRGPVTDGILRLAATLAEPRMVRAQRSPALPAPAAQPSPFRWKLFAR
jgi:pilus assembly protein CpaE